jgi:diguanylate cyclase (GGDEF)-like protein/PAS domain S-box-containing protein
MIDDEIKLQNTSMSPEDRGNRFRQESLAQRGSSMPAFMLGRLNLVERSNRTAKALFLRTRGAKINNTSQWQLPTDLARTLRSNVAAQIGQIAVLWPLHGGDTWLHFDTNTHAGNVVFIAAPEQKPVPRFASMDWDGQSDALLLDSVADIVLAVDECDTILHLGGIALGTMGLNPAGLLDLPLKALKSTAIAPLLMAIDHWEMSRVNGIPTPEFDVHFQMSSASRHFVFRKTYREHLGAGKTTRWYVGREMYLPSAEVDLNNGLNNQLRSLLDGLPAPITYVDRGLHYRFVNQAFLNWKGAHEHEVVGKSVYEILTPAFAKQSLIYWNQALSGKSVQRETKVLLADGKLRSVILHYSPKFGERGEVDGFYTLTIDIQERKELEQRLDQLATYDELTGLPNKRLAKRQLMSLLSRLNIQKQQLVCALINIDHFKNVNECFGRAMGDLVLQAIAARLRDGLPTSDVLARVDGDVFVVLSLQSFDPVNLEAYVANILKLVIAPLLLNQNKLFMTASIGVASWMAPTEDFESLVGRTDVAVATAKRAGRNTFKEYQASMDFRSAKRTWSIQDLVSALSNKQLEFWFQPIVCSKNVRIRGAEALLRWRHPTHGWVSPTEFLSVCSEAGFSYALTELTINAAISMIEERRAADEYFFVAVNFSSEQLLNPLTMSLLSSLVDARRLDPSLMEIEITEGMPLLDIPRAAETISQFQAMGFRISIDDFGTGFSSFSHLKSFNFDAIKLDKSFVDNLVHGRREQAIAQMLINLAKTLGIKVIAEGVETEAQHKLLNSLDCDMCQGYLFARPMPASEFHEFCLANAN